MPTVWISDPGHEGPCDDDCGPGQLAGVKQQVAERVGRYREAPEGCRIAGVDFFRFEYCSIEDAGDDDKWRQLRPEGRQQFLADLDSVVTMPGLSRLSMGFMPVSLQSLSAIAASSDLQSLSTLDLSFAEFPGIGEISPRLFSGLSALSYLGLSGWYHLADSDVAELVSSCPRLAAISTSHCPQLTAQVASVGARRGTAGFCFVTWDGRSGCCCPSCPCAACIAHAAAGTNWPPLAHDPYDSAGY